MFVAKGFSFGKPGICDDFPTYFWQVFVMMLCMLHMIQPRIDSIAPKSSMKLHPNGLHTMVWSVNKMNGKKDIITHCRLLSKGTGVIAKNVRVHKWQAQEIKFTADIISSIEHIIRKFSSCYLCLVICWI